mmetsp:Transcript_25605/g.54425  ORF Transcript_25605/g.54425 Transcript_25605/m.54425 type:complete len:353 (+) Transcript_25605:118-1176(+)|eukprot:CAMPEP_0172543562 /NCGR_PEP_ID=MMETSP1067-20121228/13915_1 /TAXON_ID=265564 ORGANISM="Thalassiosira punctigera, Strain Tpunct2005C2" /NCGR_SAMPLE_ID=MMETSP1067 /ASSEMBLY_ACC=CAM_ASM_000444 /LENGTH=352 /DNA_ID=CAMNT_0013329999 /DNA_START=140 /DNA_END=1198 /DNA_ORIENTATION=-
MNHRAASEAGSREISHRSDVASIEIDPDEDYGYFKDLWDRSAAAGRNDNITRNESTKLGIRRELPSARKERGRDVVANDENNMKDNGPIENIDFLRDQKKTSEGAKMPNIADDYLESKHDSYQHVVQETDPLYRHFSPPEIENLVGWATSHHGNEHNYLARTAHVDDGLRDLERRLGLSHLPMAPPPPSHIEYLHERILKRTKTNNTANNLHDESAPVGGKQNKNNANSTSISVNMDASAYVAVGMAVEEMLTAALMPLAEAHVERCRRLERWKGRDRAAAKEGSRARKRMAEEDPFDAWTLPPAEAVARLGRDGFGNRSDALTSLLDELSESTNISAERDGGRIGFDRDVK